MSEIKAVYLHNGTIVDCVEINMNLELYSQSHFIKPNTIEIKGLEYPNQNLFYQYGLKEMLNDDIFKVVCKDGSVWSHSKYDGFYKEF